MLDGTLFPIYAEPHLHGETMLDRRNSYSLSTPIVCPPDGTVVDYTAGHVGSSTDSTVYKATGLFKDQSEDGRHELLEPGGFVCGDSRNPMHEGLVIPISQSECIGSDTAADSTRLFNLTLL